MRKVEEFVVLLGEVAGGMIADGAKAVKEGLGKIAVLLQIVFPVVLLMVGFEVLDALVLSAVWCFVVACIKRLDARINNRIIDGLPLPPCRLTEGDGTAFISLAEGHEEEAIIYLSELEQYLKRRNLLNY